MTKALDALADRIADTAWAGIILAARESGKHGTMRAWFEARHGKIVYTLQGTVSADNQLIDLWTPGPREVNSRSRKGSVSLNGSSRDYAGTRVLAASDDTLIISAPFGEGTQVAAYTIP